MNKNNNQLKLTSSEIGSLWAEYVDGTMADIVNKYMVSIIEDKSIKKLFEEAIRISAKQKKQITNFIESDGFPVPIGFTESDLHKGAERLFTDAFCLNYLHIMTLHGLLGHTTSLSISVRKDLRKFYDSCDNDAKKMYHQTIELMLEKGIFQRDPLFYPTKNPEYVSSLDFKDGIFGEGRRLAATEIISISFNLKKSILAKSLSIAFSQVTQSKKVRTFFEDANKTADNQIKNLTKIMKKDNLPAPRSMETEVTVSTSSPFSDKLMLYHSGFLFQTAQVYQGIGLASAMRTDLVTTYESIILKNISVTKKWFNLMVQNKWLEQPPLAPNRKEIAKDIT